MQPKDPSGSSTALFTKCLPSSSLSSSSDTSSLSSDTKYHMIIYLKGSEQQLVPSDDFALWRSWSTKTWICSRSGWTNLLVLDSDCQSQPKWDSTVVQIRCNQMKDLYKISHKFWTLLWIDACNNNSTRLWSPKYTLIDIDLHAVILNSSELSFNFMNSDDPQCCTINMFHFHKVTLVSYSWHKWL